MCEKIFTYSFRDLRIRKNELLENLSNPDLSSYEIMKEILDNLFLELESSNEITGGYKIINSFKINSDNKSITIDNTVFKTGDIIVKQLSNTEKIAVITCTAGSWISDLPKKYMHDGNMLEGYVIDMLGSLIVEIAIGRIQESLESEVQKDCYNTTLRISPGYCGWNVEEQVKLFTLLSDDFNDISITGSAFMEPEKSLSGIIGIGKKVDHHKSLCNDCTTSNCLFNSKSGNIIKKLTRKELFYETRT